MRIIFNKTCTECKSSNILYDEHKGELFCNHCGLILDSIYENIKISQYNKDIGENKAEYMKNIYIKTKIFLE